jgi:hypothetical protein
MTPSFMKDYWDNTRLLFQQLASYGKPALVNFEPDFWGYAQRVSPDPTQMFVYVNTNPDCTSLPNTVAGLAACLIQTARQYAPQAYVGFPPSLFGDLLPTELTYMQKLGAGQADFVVMQTLDRDAGCFEAQSSAGNCIRSGSGWYWDESNTSSPNFNEHFALPTASSRDWAGPCCGGKPRWACPPRPPARKAPGATTECVTS